MVTAALSGLTTFRFTCRGVRQLYLVGDFNDWDKTSRPMQREGDGVWAARMWLAAGTYQFKYCSDDDRWFNDHAAFGIARGPFGWNSTVVVSSVEHRELSLLPPYRRAAAKDLIRLRARRKPPTPSEAMTFEQLQAILPAAVK